MNRSLTGFDEIRNESHYGGNMKIGDRLCDSKQDAPQLRRRKDAARCIEPPFPWLLGVFQQTLCQGPATQENQGKTASLEEEMERKCRQACKGVKTRGYFCTRCM